MTIICLGACITAGETEREREREREREGERERDRERERERERERNTTIIYSGLCDMGKIGHVLCAARPTIHQ